LVYVGTFYGKVGRMNEIPVALVALYRYRNFPVRIMHPLLKSIEGVKPYTVFFKNCEANVFKPPTEKEEELFIDCIKKLNPKIVGFSVLSPLMPVARKLTKLIKEKTDSLVVWGGVHPTIFPENCISDVDMLCIGEGEGALGDIVKNLRDNKPLDSIKNLWIKNKDGKVIKNPLRPLIEDLDSLPFVLYEDDNFYFIDSDKIAEKDNLRLDNYFWVQTARGCPYACSYCVNSLTRPMFKDLGKSVRRRSVDNVIKELKKNNKADFIFFFDEVFGDDEAWLHEFATKYKKEINLPFYVQYNPKNIRESVVDKLIYAGVGIVNFGIQTGSDYIRNNIFHRPGKNKEILDIVGMLSKGKMKICYDLILENPYDTEETLLDAIKFLIELPKPLLFNLYSLQYFPSYPLTKMAIRDGHIKPEDATVDKLINKTTKDWAFVPRFFPYDKKHILQNIIWLIARNHVRNSTIKYVLFGKSRFSGFCLFYLNIKAVIFGKVFGIGGFLWRNQWIVYIVNALKYALKGDFETFKRKFKKRILKRI